uniref:Tripartite motif-containing protein 3 n=1 Tax=Magallana gigas TaxID=29159 RepID=A0A8W8LTL9_MAGGI
MVCLPKFQNILSHSELRLTTIATEYQILKSAIKKHGQDMHRIVDVVTKRFEDEAEKMEHESMTELKNHISETRRSIEEMHSLIEENKRLMLSNDVGKALSYDADIERYRKGKQEIRALVPDFKRVSLTTDELCCLFGSLKTPEKEGFIEKNIIKDTGKEILPRVAKEFLLMPSISATIDSGSDHVQRVCCQETDEVWVSGNGSVITRVDMEGNVREILHTSSGYVPHDLDVTEPGELLYCDSTEKTVNVVQNGKQRAFLQYQNWRPMGIAVTVAGEIIVSLYSDLEGCSKVIKYCLGRNEEQGQETLSLERLQPKLRKVIQYDERGVCGIDIDFADKLWIGEVDSGKIKVVEYLQLADE